jgi:GT2 family glycosyltransferase
MNKKDYLIRCINSVIKKTKNVNYETIVVDNGSNDDSVSAIKKKFPKIKVISNEKNIGFAAANNQGIKLGLKNNSEYFFLLNNDTEILTDNWLEDLVNFSEKSKDIGIVGCKLLYENGKIQHTGGYVNNAGIGRNLTFNITKPKEVQYATGAALLIKKEVIDAVGFLDESFYPIYFEEVDFCFRARKIKYRIFVYPEVKILHHESITTKENKEKYLVMNKNRIRFILLNFPVYKILIMIFFEIFRMVKSLFKKRLKMLLKAYLENIKNLHEIMKKRSYLKVKRDELL